MKIKLFFSTLAIALSASLPASAQIAPITRIESRGMGYEGIHLGGFKLITPGDSMQSAYPEGGSRLLQIHIHIAKMFEITGYYCRETPLASDIPKRFALWDYQVMGGHSVGILTITCPEALNIARIYGLGPPERTEIFQPSQRGDRTVTINVPTLQISGDKIEGWMRFSENVQVRQE
jgi:hypothetical protein